MAKASEEYGWDLDFGSIALLWRGGCIIRSRFLGRIKEAYEKNPKLKNLMLDAFFAETLLRTKGLEESLRKSGGNRNRGTGIIRCIELL